MPGHDVVAAFDFDGTLTRGGSVWKFLTAMCGRDAVVSAGHRAVPQAGAGRAVRWCRGRRRPKRRSSSAPWRAGPPTTIAERAAVFGVAHYRRRHRTKVRARLDWHRRQGHRVVVVSASPEYYVRAAAAELGVDGVVATRLEVDERREADGALRGRQLPGAAEAARGSSSGWRPRLARPTAPDGDGRGRRTYLWAYGNSAGDLEMLEAADIGVDAGRLGRFGKLRRFRRLGDVLTAW